MTDNFEKFEELLTTEEGFKQVDIQDYEDMTPLHHAIFYATENVSY